MSQSQPQITFEALEQAFAPIEELGKGEITFDVADKTKVTLRVILPEEENEVQKFATFGLTQEEKGGDEEAEPAEALEFLERFKLALLSYAVVAVGEQDFRDVEYVETGEKLDNGQAVRLPKHVAVRKLIQRWGGTLRLAMYRKYTELILSMEERVQNAIKFAPSDLDAEIGRVEKLLTQLKAAKTQGDTLKTNFTEMVQSTAAVETADAEETRANADKLRAKMAGADVSEPEEAPAPTPDPAPSGERKPIIPDAAPPPVAPSEAPEPPPATEETVTPVAATDTPARPAEAPQTAFDRLEDSLLDPDDPEAAVAAENKRLLEARLSRGETGIPPAEGSVLTPNPGVVLPSGGQPPHMDAIETRDSLRAEEEAAMEELEDFQSNPAEVGTATHASGKEVPVFRGETEELAKVPPPPAEKARVNASTASEGTQNPRFRKAPTTEP